MKKIKFDFLLPSLFLGTLFLFFVLNIKLFLSTSWAAVLEQRGINEKVFSQSEKAFNDKFSKKTDFVTLNGAVHRALGQREMNSIVMLSNGKMGQINSSLSDIPEKAASVIQLESDLSQLGIPFLYVQAPFKNCSYDVQLPVGKKDFSNQNADNLVHTLQDGGVDVMDLRELLHQDGLNHYSLFFDSDHHWKPEAGFWAFTKIIRYLSELDSKFIVNSDITSLSNYNIQVYQEKFLGSLGRRVGPAYSGVDDLSIITPKFETNFIYFAPEKKLQREGSFDQALLCLDQLSRSDYFDVDLYATYLGSDFPNQQIINTKAQNDVNILLLVDSFSKVTVPFLATAYSKVHTLDLRHYSGNVLEYVENFDPDVVMLFLNPNQLVYQQHFNYYG